MTTPKHAAPCTSHKPVQHRDARPPWCNTCGLTAGGEIPQGPLDPATSDTWPYDLTEDD